jgi:hypothetical protein
VTSYAHRVGARKKWRATTSHVTAIVIGMINQEVMRPLQSAKRSMASTVLRYPVETSLWVPTGGGAIATRFYFSQILSLW